MGLIELPPVDDLAEFKSRLYHSYRIEIPTIAWQERQFLRISVQGYNTQADIDALIDALAEMLQANGGREARGGAGKYSRNLWRS